jgi:hypothetical protein
MIRASRLVLAMSAIVLFTAGCTSITIESNKDAASVRQLKRLYILIDHGETKDRILSNHLIGGLKICFSNAPVQVEYGISSALDLDPKTSTDRIDAFNPEALLILHASYYKAQDNLSIQYDASMYDFGQNREKPKRIWRASITTVGGFDWLKWRMNELAGKIAMKLQADGFLTGVSAPPPNELSRPPAGKHER